MCTTDIVDFPHHSFQNDEVDFIRQVFPDINRAEQSLSECRSILASTNQQKDEWNAKVQALQDVSTIDLPAEHVVKHSDLLDNNMTAYSNVKFPYSLLQLKIRDVLLVTATVTVETGGICNNSRVRLLSVSSNKLLLRVQKIGTQQTFLLPRQWFRCIPSGQDGVFDRLQFPIQLAYAMTIHKCQGQTMDFVGIDCSVPFFAHGQTYVAA